MLKEENPKYAESTLAVGDFRRLSGIWYTAQGGKLSIRSVFARSFDSIIVVREIRRAAANLGGGIWIIWMCSGRPIC
jgi:hypothetical protein